MNKKALFTGAIVLLVAFAVLPAANAVVLDPSGCPAGNSTAVLKLYKEYNTTYQTCMHTAGLVPTSLMKKYNTSYLGVFNVLKNKPVSNLIWAEVYYMADMYSGSKNQKSYSLSRYNKVVQYANQMINLENTPQSRALAYIVMSTAADSMYNSHTNHPTPIWSQKETYFIVMSLQNNPSGIVNDGGFDWNTSTWWDSVALSSFRQWRGYNVPQKAIDFTYKAEKAALAGKLNTQEDLKKIGFYQWKKKYLIPIVTQKSLTDDTTNTQLPIIENFISKYSSTLAKGIGVIFILGIVLLILKRRRDNRYY